MLRYSFPARASTWILSELEFSLFNYCKGNNLDSSIVEAFLENQKPKIKQLNDLVFVHRLYQEFCKDSKSRDLFEYMEKSLIEIPINDVSSRGLTVLVSCLDGPSVESFLEEILNSRPIHDFTEPRFVSRICKGLLKIKPTESMMEKINVLIQNQDINQVNISDLESVFKLESADSRLIMAEKFIERAIVLAPFINAQHSKKLVSVISNKNSELSILLAKNIVRSPSSRKLRKRFDIDKEKLVLPQVSNAPHFAYVRKIDLR